MGDIYIEPTTGMKFVWVEGGEFEIGSNGISGKKPIQRVGFWIGTYEVTQGQWNKVMGNDPSYFKLTLLVTAFPKI